MRGGGGSWLPKMHFIYSSRLGIINWCLCLSCSRLFCCGCETSAGNSSVYLTLDGFTHQKPDAPRRVSGRRTSFCHRGCDESIGEETTKRFRQAAAVQSREVRQRQLLKNEASLFWIPAGKRRSDGNHRGKVTSHNSCSAATTTTTNAATQLLLSHNAGRCKRSRDGRGRVWRYEPRGRGESLRG